MLITNESSRPYGSNHSLFLFPYLLISTLDCTKQREVPHLDILFPHWTCSTFLYFKGNNFLHKDEMMSAIQWRRMLFFVVRTYKVILQSSIYRLQVCWRWETVILWRRVLLWVVRNEIAERSFVVVASVVYCLILNIDNLLVKCCHLCNIKQRKLYCF